MKYKTLFCLGLKLIGVWFAASGLCTLLGRFPSYIVDALERPGMWTFSAYLYAFIGSGGLQLILGVYLFFGGKWVVNKAIPSNRPYCPECGYDLTGAAGQHCPECGTPFRPEDIYPRGTTRNEEPASASMTGTRQDRTHGD